MAIAINDSLLCVGLGMLGAFALIVLIPLAMDFIFKFKN